MSHEEYMRLLGCRDGLAHALVSVGKIRAALTGPNSIYLPPKRHSRKRAEVLGKIAELDKASMAISRQLDEVKSALAEHTI